MMHNKEPTFHHCSTWATSCAKRALSLAIDVKEGKDCVMVHFEFLSHLKKHSLWQVAHVILIPPSTCRRSIKILPYFTPI